MSKDFSHSIKITGELVHIRCCRVSKIVETDVCHP